MSAAVRTIHLPSATALDAIRARIQFALQTWAAQWVRGWQPTDVLAVSLCGASECPTRAHGSRYEPVSAAVGTLWLRRGAADCSRMGEAVVGDRLVPNGTYVDDWIGAALASAYAACRQELYRALLNADPPAEHAAFDLLPEHLTVLGSGAIHVACERIGIDAFADSAVWRSLPPQRMALRPRPPLTPLYLAVQRHDARLDVVLGGVDVEIPMLTDLRCGDVLRLPKRLNESLSVECQGRPVAHAVLGDFQGQKSIQLST